MRGKSQKQQVLEILNASVGETVPISEILGRTSIRYHDYVTLSVNTLIKEGYQIEKIRRSGYRRAIHGFRLISLEKKTPEIVQEVQLKVDKPQHQLAQLFLLAEQVPAEEKVVKSLKEAVFEGLHPLLITIFEATGLYLSFEIKGVKYFLSSNGWEKEKMRFRMSSDSIAAMVTTEELMILLREGIKKMIQTLIDRGETASKEKKLLLHYFDCVNNLGAKINVRD